MEPKWTFLGFVHAPGNDPEHDYQPLFDLFHERKWDYFVALEVSASGSHHAQFVIDGKLDTKQKRVVYNQLKKRYPGKRRYGLREITHSPESALNYCCKGDSHGHPPASFFSSTGITAEDVAGRHEKWYEQNRPGEIGGGVGSAPARAPRKPTVFSQLIDYFEFFTEEKGREPTIQEIKEKTLEVYCDDRRLAGTGVIRRCLQHLCLRFNTEAKRTIMNHSLDENNFLYRQ